MEKDRLLKLVEAYQEHFKQYNRPDYNETEVRNDFVNPFLKYWDGTYKIKRICHSI